MSDTQFYVVQGGQVKLLDAAQWATQILSRVPGASTNAPSAVTITAGTPSTTAVPLTWTVPTSGLTPFSYQVQYRPSGTSSWTNWNSTQTATSATVSGLTAGTSYDFRVIASNTAGSSTSGTVSAATASTAPAAPTGLTAGATTSTLISLSWTASASGTPPITYQPQYRVTGGTSWTSFGGLISGTSVVISGLAAATSYDLQVVAQNAGGTTASATITDSTAAAGTVVPGQATGLAVTDATASTLPLSWTAPTTGTSPFSYQVQYRVTGQPSFQNFGGQILGTSETITGLAAATSYDLQVQTINSAGTSVSAVFTTSTASATTMSGDGVSGSQNTGTTAPVIAGPASGTITSSSVLDVTGITITDTFAAGNGGNCTLNLNCSAGTLTATVGGVAVTGSGTATISYQNTFTSCQAAAASLTYTAPANATADTISVNLWDQQGSNNTLNIPVTVHLPSVSGGGGSGGTGNPGDATGTTASRIADMMERFGVNTFSSLSATANVWGAYPSDFSAPTVIAGINAVLGESNMTMNVREYHYAGRESIQSTWCPAVAGGTGAKFSMCVGQAGSDSDVASMIALAQASSSGSSPWLAWLEGINEPNGVGQVSQAVTDIAQTDIWTNGHTLPGISIMGPSVVIGLPEPDGYITGWAAATDIATINANSSIINVHYYPNQLPSLDDGVGRSSQMNDVFVGEHNGWGTTDPEFITEWHPTYDNSSTTLQFSEPYNGYYAPIFILEAWRAGFIGYFWFSLFDFGSTPCGLIAQNTGVSPTSLTLRDGALAIQAMYELAGTASATKHTFTPGKLVYTTSGLPAPVNTASPNSGGQTMLFQNDAGQFLLYVWNAQVAPGGTAVPVTISFSGNRTKIVEYNITNAGNNQTAVQTVTDASSITLQLAADVHLLVITY